MALSAVPLLVLGLGVTGCDGNSGDDIATAGGADKPTASTSAQPVARQEALRRFAGCMREHGVDMPDPDPNGDGPATAVGGKKISRNSPVFQKAMQACRPLLPNGGELNKPDPQQADAMREFTTCMRQHGVDMPDPDPNGGGAAPPVGVDQSGPTFRTAMKACQDKLPKWNG